jgi:predicted nucleic-acid-binding protein
MKRYLIDTNIFLRFFTKDEDKQHQETVNFFSSLEQKKYAGLICTISVLELYFTIISHYGYSYTRCQKVLEKIIFSNFKITDKYNYKIAYDLFCSHKVKFTDCLIASLDFLQKGGTIVSYDKHFDLLGVKRLTPSDFI